MPIILQEISKTFFWDFLKMIFFFYLLLGIFLEFFENITGIFLGFFYFCDFYEILPGFLLCGFSVILGGMLHKVSLHTSRGPQVVARTCSLCGRFSQCSLIYYSFIRNITS